MVIEFLGVPGSGKSTVARALRQRFERRGETVSTCFFTLPFPWQERMAVVAFLVIHPRFAFRLFARVRDFRSLVAAASVARRERRRQTLAATREIVIMDEGPTQGVCMLAIANGKDPYGLMDHITEPDLLLVLHADSLKASLRSHARTSGDNGHRYPQARTAEELRSYAHHIDAVVSRSRSNVVHESSDDGVPALVTRLVTTIDQLRGEAS